MTSQDLQATFDKLISQYMTLKKQVFEEILKDKGQRDKYHNYFGKSVYYDGAYWYINKYGTAYKYVQGGKAWDNKSKSCPQKLEGSVDLSKFNIGPNMVASQACNVAGNNIMNEDSGEMAWVDIEGNKHIYSSDAYRNRPSVCNKEPKIVSAIEYNAIPEGPPMTKNDYCLTSNIDKDDYKKLLNLNNQIMGVAKQMINKSSSLAVTDDNQQKIVEEHRSKLIKQLEILEKEEVSINERIDTVNTISMENEDNSMRNDMYNTTLLTYTMSAVLLGYIAVKLM